MKRKLLTTTLLSMSLLSLNLSAAGQMKCTDNYCIVDISKISPKVKNETIKKDIKKSEGYETLLIDNIQTIVFTDEKYIMTENEIAEYDLIQMQKNLLLPSLSSENLPSSDFLCENNLKPVQVLGIENTYECT